MNPLYNNPFSGRESSFLHRLIQRFFCSFYSLLRQFLKLFFLIVALNGLSAFSTEETFDPKVEFDALMQEEKNIFKDFQKSGKSLENYSADLQDLNQFSVCLKAIFKSKESKSFPGLELGHESPNLTKVSQSYQSASDPMTHAALTQRLVALTTGVSTTLPGLESKTPKISSNDLALKKWNDDHGFNFSDQCKCVREALIKVQNNLKELQKQIRENSQKCFNLALRTSDLMENLKPFDDPFQPTYLLYANCLSESFQEETWLHELQTNRVSIQIKQASALLLELEIMRSLYNARASNHMASTLRGKLKNLPTVPASIQALKKKRDVYTQNFFDGTEKYEESLKEISKIFPEAAIIEKFRLKRMDRYSSYCDALFAESEQLEIIDKRCEKFVRDSSLWLQDSPPMNHLFIVKNYEEFKVFCRSFLKAYHPTLVLLSLSLWIFLTAGFGFFWHKTFNAYERKIFQLSQSIDRVHKDNLQITWISVFWALFVSLPRPMLLFILGSSLLLFQQSNSVQALAYGLMITTPLSWFATTLFNLSKTGGVFERQFRIQRSQLQLMFKHWQFNSFLIQVAWLGFHIFSHPLLEKDFSSLSRTFFIILCVSVVSVFANAYSAHLPIFVLSPKVKGKDHFNGALCLGAMGIMGYSGQMAWTGFFETAKVMFGNFVLFVALWLILMFVYQITVRIMLLQRRRMAFEINLQQREELLAQRVKKSLDITGIEANDNIEDFDFDLEKLSSQTLNLVRSLTQLAGLTIVLIICAQIQPIFKILALQVPFWPEITTITVMTSFLSSYVFYLLYLNLPALLDLVIFPRFDLTQSSRHTIKYIVKSCILASGTIFSIWILRFNTKNLQVLFGVGFSGAFAFGVRDIINSLVSGTLIFILKNVRIGDTVKVGEIKGLVTHITLLNTTLITADRKETSIPNKNILNEIFSRWPSEELAHRRIFNLILPSKLSTTLLLQELQACAQTTEGVTLVPEGGVAIVKIKDGQVHCELRVLISEFRNQLSVSSALYIQILARLENLGISCKDVTIQNGICD